MQSFFCEPHEQIRFFTQPFHYFSAHSHNSIEVIFMLEGCNRVNVSGTEYDVSAGSVLIVPTNAVHSANNPEIYCQSIVLIADPRWLLGKASKLSSYAPTNPLWKDPQKTSMIWTLLQNLKKNRNIISTDSFIALISSVLCLILDDMTLHSTRDKLRAEQRILDFCQKHYTEPITVEQVASTLGLSATYVSHIFNGTLNTSFPTYINGLRLYHSMQLLAETNLPVAEIYSRAGFTSLRTFNRIFAEHNSCTPLQWRKSNHKKELSNPNIHIETR